MPKLSIITINLNNLTGLQKTMESVFFQAFKDYEYIIIDGGSTDGSKEFIEQHADKLTYWVSENDGGVYNAMNKGMRQSKGEYLLFLNSGDFILDENVIVKLIQSGLKADINYGDIQWSENQEIFAGDFPSQLTFKYFTNASLPHQATFIRRELFDQVGGYDESLKIVSDWKFFLLAIFHFNYSYEHKEILMTHCERDGLSCLPENWPLVVTERKAVLQEYFPQFLRDIEIYNQHEKKLRDKIEKLEKDQTLFGLRLHKKINKIFKRS